MPIIPWLWVSFCSKAVTVSRSINQIKNSKFLVSVMCDYCSLISTNDSKHLYIRQNGFASHQRRNWPQIPDLSWSRSKDSFGQQSTLRVDISVRLDYFVDRHNKSFSYYFILNCKTRIIVMILLLVYCAVNNIKKCLIFIFHTIQYTSSFFVE